jgi:hypothetical protein
MCGQFLCVEEKMFKGEKFRNNFFWTKPNIKENNVSRLNFIEENHAIGL